MRKYALMLFLLCLHGLARGQTEAYYWFDNQEGKPMQSPMVQGLFSVDASTLTNGIHSFHYLVAETNGGISSPVSNYFVKVANNATQSPIICLCSVDGRQVYQQSLSADGGIIHWDLDMADVADGLHMLQIEALTPIGAICNSHNVYFVKMSETSHSQKGYYWFDDEKIPQEAKVMNGSFEVDVSSLTDGFHRFCYLASLDDGGITIPAKNYFLKVAQLAEYDSLNCICTVDGQLRHIEKLSQEGGVIHWNLDMQDLTDGIHQIQLQAVTKSGALSSSYNSYFMRVTTNEELSKMRCVYAIDNGSLHTNSNVVSSNGSYHFDLDLSELDDGLHYISVLLHNDRGTISKVQTRFFVKVPIGGNGITQYQYWLNDDDFSLAKTVTLPQKVNPLQLMSLLPVESRPLRSSMFHFEVSSGKPMIYAMNTIHLRFYDAAMRFSDVAKDYTDYSIGQEVNIIKTLESGVRETTTWPEENEIKWYQVTAERGDSLRFKLDHAATLQLFAPSGKEVYNVSGAESVSWGGLHVAEDGTFYVALHDVTATQGDDISIDYEHIDKYAVLRQDVAIVGNGGCSTITFEGNGFRDLYAVDLYNEQGDSIKHIFIGHESNATTSVAFDFTGAALGNYHAKFHFAEGDKVFTNLVTVEEAVDIELATTVTYPSVFLRGTTTTYTVKITNTGNMTAYSVPIITYIKSKTSNGISHIDYDGLGLPSLFSLLDMDSLSLTDINELKVIENEYGALPYFLQAKVAEDNDSSYIKTGMFFANIAPNSSKTLYLKITSDENIDAWFTTPNKWISFSSIVQTNNARNKTISDILDTAEDYYCCYRDKIECFLEIKIAALDIVSAVLSTIVICQPELVESVGLAALAADLESCKTSIRYDHLKAFGETLCYSTKQSIEERLLEALIAKAKSAYSTSTVISCIGAALAGVSSKLKLTSKTIKTVITVVSGMLSGTSIDLDAIQLLLNDNSSCKHIFEKKPNCPPKPGGGGGLSNSVASLDPNDIFGYSAESGSHAVKDGQTDVYYRIEFENDTAFATAAAHEIVVTDTLDATRFNLSTFAPTRVNIGKKSAELNGDKNFVTTIDMRPDINAIAQVEGTFDELNGIARWHISSLDPMTMEPTDDVMQGVLPVNHNGNGIGELSYDISLKPGLAHGTEVKNRAGIVFDTNDVIMTPYWTNIIDRIAPESHVTNVKMLNDSTAAVSIAATDELSGPWRYNVYVQYGDGAWFLGAEDVPIDTTASVKVYEGINHGFYVVVTDSAGNVEQKEAVREYTFEVFGSQKETNTKIQLAQGWNWISHNQNTALSVEAFKPHVLTIVSRTAELQKNSQQGWIGYLEELLPTEMYKVQATEASDMQLSGLLFNAAFRSIPLAKGWNWIGYPVVNVMSVSEALTKLKADEDDAIMSQDGIALFSDGNWTGTLTTMTPGIGYMYRSGSDKSFFLNASAQASARKIEATPERGGMAWTADKRKYRNVMGLIGHLYKDESLESNEDWIVGAFCNDECRGIAQDVDGHLMMNVFGEDGETIVFRAMRLTTGEILPIVEEVPMCSDLLGNFHSPYDLHIGSKTGIVSTEHYQPTNNEDVYDVQGRKVDKSRMKKGVYVIVNDHQKQIQKVIK